MSYLCLTSDLGVSGNMFGGRLMSLLDQAAAIYATQTTLEPRVVSRKFSEIEFKSPVNVGDILEIYAGNPRKGHTSIAFDVVVSVGRVERFHASCVFVATNPDGSKKAIDWSVTSLSDRQDGE